MPNHVKNFIAFDCPDDYLRTIIKFVGSKRYFFDFNKILPTPINIVYEDDARVWRKRYWGVHSNGFKESAMNPYFYPTLAEMSHLSYCFEGLEVKTFKPIFEFETEWTKPIPVLKQLSVLFPEVTIFSFSFAEEIEWGHFDSFKAGCLGSSKKETFANFQTGTSKLIHGIRKYFDNESYEEYLETRWRDSSTPMEQKICEAYLADLTA